MPKFYLYEETYCKTWYKYYYSIEANSEEEAIELIKNEEVDAYDSEMIDVEYSDDYQEIFNEDGKLLYSNL